MPLENVSGIPLEWDAVINTDNLEAGFKTVEDNLNNLLDSFQKFSTRSDNAIENLVKRFQDLDAAQKTLQEAQSKNTDPSVNKAYSDSLAIILKQMQDLAAEIKAIPNLPSIAPIDIKVSPSSLNEQFAAITERANILGDSFNDIGLKADPVLSSLVQKFVDLQKVTATYTDAIQNTSDPVQLKQFSSELENVKSQLLSVADQIKSFPTDTLKFAGIGDTSTQIKSVTDNVNGLISALGQIPGKADPALNGLIEKFGELQKQQITYKEELSKTTDDSQQKALLTSLNDTESKLKQIAAEINRFPQIKISGGLNIASAQADIKTLVNDFVQLGVTGEGSLKKLSSALNVTENVAKNKQALDDFISSLNKLGGNTGLATLATQFSELTQQHLLLKDELSKSTDPVQITRLNAELQKTETELKKISNQILTLPQTPDESPKVEKVINANTRLLQIKHELQNIALTPGGHGSEEFEKLTLEAEKLRSVVSNVNQELAHADTRSITALKEGVRGLVGAFEAVSGSIALFGGNSKEAEEATRAVIGAMGILNGLQEITALLSKNSAVNFYLEGLAHKSVAVATEEEVAALAAANVARVEATVAAQGITIAEAEQVVATEAATVAQKGLNVAMLANPVGIILASLVGLFVAYEAYIHTIGKATDAEKENEAAREALKESHEKAAESIAKEEGELNRLVATGKNELLSRHQRQSAINEAISKHPEFLTGLTLENIATAEGNKLLQLQAGLIRARAEARAADSVVDDRLKDQIKAQNELNEALHEGATLGEKFRLFFSQGLTENIDATKIRVAQEDLNEATIKANGAIKTQTDLNNFLAAAYSTDTEQIKHFIEQLDLIISRTTGVVKALAEQQKAAANFKLKTGFDEKDFENQKKLIDAQGQYDLAKTKQGTTANLVAQRKLINDNYNELLKDRRIFDDKGNAKDKEHEAEALAIHTDHLQKVNALNEEFSQRASKSEVAAAEALVLKLQATGAEGTKAFYEAKVNAIRAAAAEARSQEGVTAGEIKRINAQMQLDLTNLAIDFSKKQLENDKSALQARLNAVKVGTAEELQLKIAMIETQKQIEEKAINLSAEKRREIESRVAKEIAELTKKFDFDRTKDTINTEESVIQSRLATVEKGTFAEIELQRNLIDEKAALDILAERNSEDLEEKKNAKIFEINAKAFADRKKLEDSFFADQLKDQFEAIDRASEKDRQSLEFTGRDPFADEEEKLLAKAREFDILISDTDEKIHAAKRQIANNEGEVKSLHITIHNLEHDLANLTNERNNIEAQRHILYLQQVAKNIGQISSSFSSLSGILKDVDSELSEIIGTLGNVGAAAASAFSNIAQIKKGQQEKGLTSVSDIASGAAGLAGSFLSVVGVIQGIINKAAEARRQQRIELEKEQTDIITGEIAINEKYRERLVIQSQINKLKLEGIKAEAEALAKNQESNAKDFADILSRIQALKAYDPNKVKTFPDGSIVLANGTVIPANQVAAFGNLAGKNFDELEKLFLTGQLEGKARDLFETLEKLKNEGVDIDAALEQNKQKAQELFTGTTAQNIVDTIADGFSQGFKSVKDFATKTEDIIRGALINALKTQALEGPIRKLFDQFAADAESGGGLDQSEIANFQSSLNKTISDAEKFAEQIQKATGVNLAAVTGNTNSLAGSLKAQLTEQTGSIIAGSIHGIQMTAIQQLTVANRSLEQFNKIQANTLATSNGVQDLLRLHRLWTAGDRVKVA